MDKCWVWEVGHEEIEVHGECERGLDAFEAAQRAVAKMEAEQPAPKYSDHWLRNAQRLDAEDRARGEV